MAKPDSIFLSTFLYQTLNKIREKSELGVVEGVEIIGTKIFQNLGEGLFVYGPYIYSAIDLPMAARVDMDIENLQPLCSALEWALMTDHSINTKLVRVEEKPVEVSRRATLITSSKELANV